MSWSIIPLTLLGILIFTFFFFNFLLKLLAELRTIGLCDATDSELSIRHLAYTSPDTRDWLLSPYERSKPRRKNLSNDESLLLEPPNRDIVLDKIVYKIRVTNLDADSPQHWSENISRTDNERQKYHSAVNRFKSDSVARSKSFQEQGVKPLMRNSRFFVNRHNHFSDYSIDTMSQNIEITIQDADGTPVDINRAAASSSSNYSTFKCSPERVKSGHILGRIFRRMRKISLGWRKSRCKIRRGEWVFI